MEEKQTLKWEIGTHLKRLPLTSEYIFKRIFAKEENNSLLKDFLEAILKRKISKVIVINPEIPKDLLDGKMGIIEIRAKFDNNEMIDIEMEMRNEYNIKEKEATSLTKLLSEKLNVEYEYAQKKKIIIIQIFNFNCLKRNAYHSIAKMKFDESKNDACVDMGYVQEDDIATDMVEMHYIELPKFVQKNSECRTKLEQWLCFITGKFEEKLEMVIEDNEEIRKAVIALEEISKDYEEKEIYECRKKAELEYIETVDYFTRKRIKEGMEKGERKGRKEQKIEIAKKMLQENIPIESIIQVTGLSKAEIEENSNIYC